MTKKQPTTRQDGTATPGVFARIIGSLRDFKSYVELSKGEMRKVTWPTLKETRTTSMVVLGFVAVMVLFLGLVDLGFSKLISLVLSA